MIRNYYLTAYRNLKRNKVYAILNIAGLALGIGCAIVIFKVISYELSFDQHLTNYDNIYRVIRETQRAEGHAFDAGAAHPLANALRQEFPKFREVGTVDFQPNMQVNVKNDQGEYDRYLEEMGVAFAQLSILKILDVSLIAGNPDVVLKNPNEAIISVEWMKRFYGYGEDQAQLAMGKSINLANKKDLTVVGVYRDFPETTDFPFKMIVNYMTLDGLSRYFLKGESWHNVSSTTSCLGLLEDNTDPLEIERSLPDLVEKYVGEKESNFLSLRLQPLSDVHFNQELYNYPERTINSQILIALAIIGLVLIVTACINFINLATAQAVKRSKEIGIRKVMGGYRMQLIFQFLSETLMITFFAVLVSLGIAEVLMVNLSDVLSYQLHLNLINEPQIILYLVFLTSFVALLSGLYPAFLLSRVDAVSALKARLTASSIGGFSLRRVLVIFQFGISQLLIICTLIVTSQMDYFRSKNLGFRKDGIIVTYLPENTPNDLQRLKDGLLAHPEIELVSFNLSAPTGDSNSFSNFNYEPANIDEDPHANIKIVDEDYFYLFDINLITGRRLTNKDSNAVVVNLEVVKLMGLSDPNDVIGEHLKGGGVGGYSHMLIVGVVDNYHTASLQDGLDLVIMIHEPRVFYEAAVSFNQLGLSNAREIVEKEWSNVFPEYVFDFDFYDQQLAENYEDEQGVAKLLTIFAMIAIFIGCLGLYGLVTFMANQKTKEIGIRKVLGASLADILKIFSKELVILLFVAFIIAGPIALFSMESWLTNFDYHIGIRPEKFIISIAISLAIALLTMGYRSFKSAITNPVEALKDE